MDDHGPRLQQLTKLAIRAATVVSDEIRIEGEPNARNRDGFRCCLAVNRT
jgi:hypothetical protein